MSRNKTPLPSPEISSFAFRIAAGRGQIQRVIFPVVADAGNFAAGQHVAGAAQNFRRQLAVEFLAARRELERVAVAGNDVHAPVTFVLQRERAVRFHAQRFAVERIQRRRLGMHVRRDDRRLALAVADAGELPVLRRVRILERAVAHQFGINAAVGGQVDVLEENSPQRRRNRVAGMRRVHGDFRRLGWWKWPPPARRQNSFSVLQHQNSMLGQPMPQPQ